MIDKLAQTGNQVIEAIEFDLQLTQYPRPKRHQLSVGGIQKCDEVIHIPATAKLICDFVEALAPILRVSNNFKNFLLNHSFIS